METEFQQHYNTLGLAELGIHFLLTWGFFRSSKWKQYRSDNSGFSSLQSGTIILILSLFVMPSWFNCPPPKEAHISNILLTYGLYSYWPLSSKIPQNTVTSTLPEEKQISQKTFYFVPSISNGLHSLGPKRRKSD